MWYLIIVSREHDFDVVEDDYLKFGSTPFFFNIPAKKIIFQCNFKTGKIQIISYYFC